MVEEEEEEEIIWDGQYTSTEEEEEEEAEPQEAEPHTGTSAIFMSCMPAWVRQSLCLSVSPLAHLSVRPYMIFVHIFFFVSFFDIRNMFRFLCQSLLSFLPSVLLVFWNQMIV